MRALAMVCVVSMLSPTIARADEDEDGAPAVEPEDEPQTVEVPRDMFVPKVVMLAGFGVAAISFGVMIHAAGTINDYQDGVGAMGPNGEILGSADCDRDPAPGDPQADDFERACSANRRTWIAGAGITLGFIVGTSALIYYLAHRNDKRTITVSPTASAEGAGAMLQIRW